VFVRLNNTGSTIGEECLYKLLREPSFEPEVLTERQRLIAYFQNDPAKRLELQILLAKLYRSVHFQEVISNEGIIFDYELYDGRATSRNAIRLLRLIGYSDAIVHEAAKQANLFMEQGTWQAIS
jgi:DNA mismatch repair ATPase MutS